MIRAYSQRVCAGACSRAGCRRLFGASVDFDTIVELQLGLVGSRKHRVPFLQFVPRDSEAAIGLTAIAQLNTPPQFLVQESRFIHQGKASRLRLPLKVCRKRCLPRTRETADQMKCGHRPPRPPCLCANCLEPSLKVATIQR